MISKVAKYAVTLKNKNAPRVFTVARASQKRLFRALINPGTDEADLFRRERLGSGLVWHRRRPVVFFTRGVGDALDDKAIRTVASFQDRSLFGAFENAFQRFHVQLGLGAFAAVAFRAIGVEDGFEVGGVGHVFFVGGGWQLGVFGAGREGETECRSQSRERDFGAIHMDLIGLVSRIREIGRQNRAKGSIYFCGMTASFLKRGGRGLKLPGGSANLGGVSDQNFSDAALVVMGHGTTLNDQSAAPVLQHVAELRRRKIFGEVREAFWKQEPHIKKVLAELTAPRIFIVPFFISEGYFSTEVIPTELGFDYPDHLLLVTHQSSLFYCLPVGSHDLMTTVILARAKEVMEKFPFPRPPKNSDTTLLIAGHGTGRNANSRKAVERQVELIRVLNIFADVGAVFMEEAPFIKGCWQNVTTRNIVVVPFFISDGLHAVEDIPVLLGEPERIVKERLAAGQPTWRNPTEREGKLIWYASSVGTEPLLADVILQRVKEVAK